MKRRVLVAGLAGLLPFALATARPLATQADSTQESTSQNTPKMKAGMRQIPEGTTINARLMKPIDAEQSKPGDEVDAKASAAVKVGGRVIIPAGTKLVGHITQVKAKSDDERTSTVLVAFDKAILKSGAEVPLHAAIASIARPQASASPTDALPGDMGMPAETMGSPSATPRGGVGGGGGLIGSTSSTGNAKRKSTSAAAPPPAPGQEPDSEPKSTAAFTIEQRENGSVISSNSRNVHLDSGTQLLLKVLPAR